jgi:hypothetical protein
VLPGARIRLEVIHPLEFSRSFAAKPCVVGEAQWLHQKRLGFAAREKQASRLGGACAHSGTAENVLPDDLLNYLLDTAKQRLSERPSLVCEARLTLPAPPRWFQIPARDTRPACSLQERKPLNGIVDVAFLQAILDSAT